MNNFLNDYIKEIIYKKVADGWDLTLPFRFFNGETIITLHLKKNKGGFYDIDDKGNTFKYLESIDANIQEYSARIEIICTLFSLKIEGNVVKGVIGYGTNQTYKQLHNFLQGLSHLSTIKFFD